MEKEEIKKMIDRANGFSKKGKNNAALQAVGEALAEIDLLSDGDVKQSLSGLAQHYRGSILQRMGEYDKAVEAIEWAIEKRENDPVAKAYSVFQLFICKEYGKLPITDEEVMDTKMALIAAMVDDAVSIADIGNMLQNFAYVEQVKGSVHKAILFYEMALDARRTADDKRGTALTQARLAECHKEVGNDGVARMYAKKALVYFEEIGDVERIEQINAVFGRK